MTQKLKNRESIYIENHELYILSEGKILIREVFPNGKIVKSEYPVEVGDIFGNLFYVFGLYDKVIDGMCVEVEAIGDVSFVKVQIEGELKNNITGEDTIYGKMLKQVLRKNLLSTFYHLYDKKGYILAVLRLYNNFENKIPKSVLNHEVFNLSRSQFYAVMTEIKNENYLVYDGMNYTMNIDSVEKYLYLN